MPTFAREGHLHTVSHITGPTHVWLGIEFSREHVGEPNMIARPARCSHGHGEQDPEKIKSAVIAGAARFGLHVSRIEYVLNDSPNYSLYLYCSGLLAERAATEIKPD